MLQNFKKIVKRFPRPADYSPHKTFRLTRRRDYVRSFSLPHPLVFILEVTQTLWKYRKVFIPLSLVYLLLYAVLVGVGSQEIYEQLGSSISEAGGDLLTGAFGPITQSGLTVLALVTNGISPELSDAQRIFGVLLTLMAWLTTVWLLRNILAGNTVKMRDGLYSAGSPIVATAVVALIIALQLLPLALAAVGYSAAVSSGLLTNGGVEAMLFWIAASLLGILSLYWISSSLFAMVIITLPGMYPIKALRSSYRLLLGRRIRFLIRYLWMGVFIVALWAIVLIPSILFDSWLKSTWSATAWVPIVPGVLLVLGTYTVFWVSTYIYLLYRKVVDANDPA